MLDDPALLKSEAYYKGHWYPAADEAVFAVVNPATGDTIGHVPDMGQAETGQAIQAAYETFPGWAGLLAKERAAFLKDWFALIMAHQKDLATIISLECGKPYREALGEVAYGASFIEWFAEEGKRCYGDMIPTTGQDRRLMVINQPVGVVAAITPWNFPLAMITRKCGPALAAGCPIVIKPSEATPLSALALAELAARAGLPAGVLNVITTQQGAEVGQAFCSSPWVRKLSFTGSTAVGKQLLRQCAEGVKKVSLELGGNAPFIVFSDADMNAAVAGAMAAKYRNAGQTCVCANRFIVQADIHDIFVQKLAEATQNLSVGCGLDEGVTQGPLITQRAVGKMEQLVQDAVAKGAKIICGGQKIPGPGHFYQPTVLTDMTCDMTMTRTEIFGPVSPVFRFETEAEALALANDTPYGLAAYFYSRDMGRCIRVSEALEAGIVGVNEGIISTEVAPFGGVKESGIGREGSKYGMMEYLTLKYICLGGL